MNFSAKHIYLRPVKKDDALAIHLYAGNPEVTRYMLWGQMIMRTQFVC